MAMFACPSISCTIFGCVPLDRRSVAHVCLRSWNLMRGKSARSRSGLNERYVRLPTSVGVPTVEVNTKPVSPTLSRPSSVPRSALPSGPPGPRRRRRRASPRAPCRAWVVLVFLFNSPEKAGGVITIVATAAASMILISILLSVLSTVFRYQRASGMERQQLKWAALAAALAGLFALGHLLSLDPLLPESLWNLLDVATITGLYIAVGIAVLKYRLYDLDLVVNRALVYGALTASVVAIYVLVVGYLGALFRTGGNLFVSLVATGLVAVLFQPLRERLQRGVNRLMHGERDEPYAVVSRLGQRLEATHSPG